MPFYILLSQFSQLIYMPLNYFVTGMPKSGKTTVLKGVVKALKKKGLRVGGFLSPERKQHGTRVAFEIEDIETGRTAKLASVKPPGPKVSKYYVKVRQFESVALPTMKNIDMYDVYVIDEIGRMEMKSSSFMDMLEKAFKSPTPVIASVSNEFIDMYKVRGKAINISPTNREAVLLQLTKETTEVYKKKKPKRAKTKRKKKTKKKKTKRKKPAKKKLKKKKKRRGIIRRIRDILPF